MWHPAEGERFDELRLCGFMAAQYRISTRMEDGHTVRKACGASVLFTVEARRRSAPI
ncbi:MAG: hypothetical protein JOY71_01260 [Acetobacteraceae bacterium]|nr:hypothetical protein [Acetobacteraceae bacterium]MBV8592044.1 hypothetical protein [Acetobacteraceae bacterium]